ncbi:hypothetical protein DL546_008446 [Coniochaeta pulveracea]|uniref:Sodium/calcium exchanger membrane region domain-containing protein n=1 Tax=Coniochaeta pulveracea TaxID=177199 RepID=A0A420YDD8_9PEZI|nr:hypothetical protein DL546_008446 [Coniochaeta pulveracea]
MQSVNHAQIRRQAHTLGRQDTGWFNPFGHTFKNRKTASKHKTWDSSELEAQNGNGTLVGEPMTHYPTEPGSSVRPQSDEEDNATAYAKREEARGIDHSPTDNSTAPLRRSSSHTVTQPSAVRQRNGVSGRNEKDEVVNGEEEEEGNGKKKKEHRMFKSVQPKEPFTVANQLQRTVLNSWINVLLIMVPVGIAVNYVHSIPRVAVFVLNFIAIIPLAAMLSFSTEEIALRTGETLGGLLNATFGNAVELIVAIMALTQKPAKVIIVQTSLIGSILSNLLLVLGMCFFFGGLRRQEQFFNTTVAQTAASLLALAVASIIIPTVFDNNTDTKQSDIDVAALSRGTAVILLVVYAGYLFFQLKTHHAVFSAESQKVAAKPWSKRVSKGAVGKALAGNGAMLAHGTMPENHGPDASDSDALRKVMEKSSDDEDEEEYPQLHFWVAIATLTISTVLIAFCAEFMVDSIDAVTKSGGLSEEFVGLILLPIVGNAAEHATAVTVAIKDKMDLAIGVAVGSSMQVALFLIPLVVVIGWCMGLTDMTLSFDTFQVAVLFVAVLLVNYLIADGKSHWLEGMQLMCLYVIIAVCSIWYPAAEDSSSQPS